MVLAPGKRNRYGLQPRVRERALRFCLAADLLGFFLTYVGYEILDYYERAKSGFYVWPGALFCLSFLATICALLATLLVILFGRREPPPSEGTGLSPE